MHLALVCGTEIGCGKRVLTRLRDVALNTARCGAESPSTPSASARATRLRDHRADTKPTHTHSHSILYQRGVYPPESFQQRKQYGLSVMVTADDKLAKYLATVLEHVQGWKEGESDERRKKGW